MPAPCAALMIAASHLLLLTFLLHHPSLALSSSCHPPLIIFGASMMDVGQNAHAMPLRSGSEFPPFGVDYFHRPAARFSNGRVISDFLSQGLGYGLLDPFLNSVEPNFAHGVNFASSGSTARNTTVQGNGTQSGGLFSFSVQIDQYKSFKAKVLLAQSKNNDSLTNLPSASRLSHAVHIVATAHNDYISTAFLTSNFDPLSTVLSTISAVEHGIRELHSAGAKNIIIMNVIPLGCTPGFLPAGAALGIPTLDKDGCLSAYNDLVDLHNTHLEKLLSELRVELSLKHLVLFDANAIYMDAVRNPSKYGVAYPLESCCGKFHGTPVIACGQSATINGTLVEAGRCEDPSLYISWDGLHFVETFAKHLADGVLSGEFLKPEFVISNSCDA